MSFYIVGIDRDIKDTTVLPVVKYAWGTYALTVQKSWFKWGNVLCVYPLSVHGHPGPWPWKLWCSLVDLINCTHFPAVPVHAGAMSYCFTQSSHCLYIILCMQNNIHCYILIFKIDLFLHFWSARHPKTTLGHKSIFHFVMLAILTYFWKGVLALLKWRLSVAFLPATTFWSLHVYLVTQSLLGFR